MRPLLRLLTVAVLALVVVAAVVLVHRPRGYFDPVFATDGRSVFVIVRDVRAAVLGLGYEFFTPPASVWLLRDRFELARLHVADGRLERLAPLPASPLEGARISAYRSGLYGSVQASLRRTGQAVEYQVAVTRHDSPLARTFVLRGRWTPGAPGETGSWTEGSTTGGGGRPEHLSGAFEALAVRGDAPMPCAVVLLSTGEEPSRSLAETSDCRTRFPDGYDVAAVREQSRRELIERAQLLERTRDELVAEGRRQGLSEGDAALNAIRGMQRLGLYPKPTTIVARPAGDDEPAGEAVFEISDREFQVGLFSDIREALEHPGAPAEKDSGRYIVHDDFTTSERLNAAIAGGATSFLVRARGRLWRMTIERPERR